MLVVRDEFTCDVDGSEDSKNVVGGAELRGLLEGGDVGRHTKEEKNNVLNGG